MATPQNAPKKLEAFHRMEIEPMKDQDRIRREPIPPGRYAEQLAGLIQELDQNPVLAMPLSSEGVYQLEDEVDRFSVWTRRHRDRYPDLVCRHRYRLNVLKLAALITILDGESTEVITLRAINHAALITTAAVVAEVKAGRELLTTYKRF